MALDPNARLIITANDATRAAWDSATRQASTSAKKIGGVLAGALTFAGLKKVFTDFLKPALETADAIGKISTKTGLTTQAVSEIGFAAKGAGIEIKELGRAFLVMQSSISKADGGAKALGETFRGIGLDISRLSDLAPDRQFEFIAEAISRIPDEADRARAATELFGKAGANLLPLFEEGAEGIRKAREEAKGLGLSMGPEAQKLLQVTGDELGKLKEASLGLAGTLTEKLAPAIAGLAFGLTKVVEVINGSKTADQEFNDLILRRAVLLERIRDAQKGTTAREVLGLNDQDREELIGVEDELRVRNANKLSAIEAEKERKRKEAGVLTDQVEIDVPGQPSVRDIFGGGPDPDVRRKIDELKELRELEMEGEIERNRILDEAQGGGVQGERRERMLEEEREYFAKLQEIVEKNAEESVEQSERVLDEYSDRLQEKVMERNEVLIGAMQEFGRSVQSSLSDVFFNAGKGADGFATSVLNAFKRILADAAAQKVVSLLGGLLGGKKDPGVGGGGTGGTAGILGSIFSAFVGARAEGGPVTGGLGYLVGERGPELFMPRQSGAIVPNSALGRGGMSVIVNQVTNVDARGATQDGMKELMRQLPGILEQNRRRTKDEIREDINRGRFGLK